MTPIFRPRPCAGCRFSWRLVRNQRFDLILRTRKPLPDFMRQDIERIFHDANDAAGYAGNIGFQSSVKWHFMPIEAPAGAAPSVVV